MLEILKRFYHLVNKVIDALLALILFCCGLIYASLLCFFVKIKIVESADQILFVSSGKPIKPNKIPDEKYQAEWRKYMRDQFLSFNNTKAFVFYSSDEYPCVYKLTKGVCGMDIGALKVRFNLKKLFSVLNFWRDFFAIRKILKDHNLSKLVSYAPSDRMMLCGFLRFFLNIRLYAAVMGNSDLAWSEHEYNSHKFKKLILHIYEKVIAFFYFQKSDLVIAYNNHIGDYALCNGASPDKIRRTRIYPCITEFDEAKVIPKSKLEGFPKTKKCILMWSRFSYEKKIPHALKGAIEALKKDLNLGLCIIGYGPLETKIKEIVENSFVSDRISVVGFTPSYVLLSYIYHADIALIPLGGFSMLEACLLKKPIVCFDIEWHHELLTDGYSGYFADYADSEMISDKILEALSDPKEAKSRGQRAYERFRFLFDEEKIRKRNIDIFKRKNLG